MPPSADRTATVRALAAWFGLACVAALALVATSDREARSQEEGETVAAGAALYNAYCAACHGADGSGMDHLEGVMAGPAIDDIDVAYADLTIRTGRMPIVERDAGIIRQPDLGAEERDAIVAFMAERFELEGEVPTVPDASPVPGRVLFNEHCAACHRTTGTGGVAGEGVTVLPARGLDEVAIWSATRIGPFGMPAFSEEIISDDDLASIAAAVKKMDEERPTLLGIVDVDHVIGTWFMVGTMVVLLGAIVLIARFPRAQASYEETQADLEAGGERMGE
jgi:ubiquinol-cytochrome c reductase cytochrome c subunit